MNQYEIEIKSLLSSENEVNKFRKVLKEKFENLEFLEENTQLNHYFDFDSSLLENLEKKFEWMISQEQKAKLQNIIEKGKKHAVRTRYINNKSVLIIKASIDDTTSENGTARMEWEEYFDMQIDELDRILLDLWFVYQSKWSREREEYKAWNINICIDKSPWYGYRAELELLITDPSEADEKKKYLRELIEEMWFTELDQNRLERMFKFYCANWADYYGQDKYFVID